MADTFNIVKNSHNKSKKNACGNHFNGSKTQNRPLMEM